MPPGAPDGPGLEVSGTIEETGAGVGPWDFGTPVCALLTGGGYAEYVAVPEGQVVPVPDGVSLTDAAGLPEVAATCWSNLVMEAGVKAGDWVLVHGGAGGIGSFALQLLAALARPLATAGSPEKVQRCLELGAETAINHREEDFAERVREITDGHGADVILDVIGAKYLERNVDAMARGGRLVVIGLQGGGSGTLPLGKLMGVNGSVTGTLLRPRPVQEKAEIMRQVREQVWPLVSAGKIRTTTDATFPLDLAAQAQDRFEETDPPARCCSSPRPPPGTPPTQCTPARPGTAGDGRTVRPRTPEEEGRARARHGPWRRRHDRLPVPGALLAGRGRGAAQRDHPAGRDERAGERRQRAPSCCRGSGSCASRPGANTRSTGWRRRRPSRTCTGYCPGPADDLATTAQAAAMFRLGQSSLQSVGRRAEKVVAAVEEAETLRPGA